MNGKFCKIWIAPEELVNEGQYSHKDVDIVLVPCGTFVEVIDIETRHETKLKICDVKYNEHRIIVEGKAYSMSSKQILNWEECSLADKEKLYTPDK